MYGNTTLDERRNCDRQLKNDYNHLPENSVDETECLLNPTMEESDVQIGENLDCLPQNVPLSLVCSTTVIDNVISKLFERSKGTLCMYLCCFTFYFAVLIASIIIYVTYRGCQTVHRFGESSIGITTYLIVCFLFTTIAAYINWMHCRKLLRSKREVKGKKRNKRTCGKNRSDQILNKSLHAEDFILSLLDKAESNQSNTLINVLKMGDFISRHKISNKSLQEVLESNKKSNNSHSESDLETAINTVRKYMKNTRGNSNSNHLNNTKVTKFQIFLFHMNVLPVLSAIFWILLGVDAAKRNQEANNNCYVPLIYFWIITISISLMSLFQLIPMIVQLFSKQ